MKIGETYIHKTGSPRLIVYKVLKTKVFARDLFGEEYTNKRVDFERNYIPEKKYQEDKKSKDFEAKVFKYLSKNLDLKIDQGFSLYSGEYTLKVEVTLGGEVVAHDSVTLPGGSG